VRMAVDRRTHSLEPAWHTLRRPVPGGDGRRVGRGYRMDGRWIHGLFA
jgi:hypothetical protein